MRIPSPDAEGFGDALEMPRVHRLGQRILREPPRIQGFIALEVGWNNCVYVVHIVKAKIDGLFGKV